MTETFKYPSIRLPLIFVVMVCSLYLIIPDFLNNSPSQERLSGIILFILINAYLVNQLRKILASPKKLTLKDNKIIFDYYNKPKKTISVSDVERFDYIGESRLLRKIRNLNILLKEDETITIFYSISNYEQLIKKLSDMTGYSPDSSVE